MTPITLKSYQQAALDSLAALARAGTPLLDINSVFDSYSRPLDGREVPVSPSKEVPALLPGLFAPDAVAADLASPPVPAEVLAELPAPVLLLRTAYCLLFNGILGDKHPALARVTFKHIPYDVRAR